MVMVGADIHDRPAGMMKSCGIAVPQNPSGNAPALPRIIWHDARTAFVGESMLAAQAAAKETFGSEPDLVFVALPGKEKALYQEVCLACCNQWAHLLLERPQSG